MLTTTLVFIPAGQPFVDEAVTPPETYSGGQIYSLDTSTQDGIDAVNRIISAGGGFDVSRLVAGLIQIAWIQVTGKPGSFTPSAHSHSASDIVSGTLDVLRVPNLDASKIATGILEVARIPDLDASKITSGVLGDDRVSPSNVTQHQSLFELTQSQVTGLVDALASKVDLVEKGVANGLATLGVEGVVPVDQVPNLPASKINSGVLSTEQIPSLDADKIASGILGVGRIPNLDAAKIATGILELARIPDLDAAKITSGVFSPDRISSESVTQHAGSLVLDQDQITGLPAALDSKVDDSQVGVANGVASLNVSGVVPVVQIPGLGTDKIISGVFANERISQSSVKQYEAALSLTLSQITDRGALTSHDTVSTGLVDDGAITESKLSAAVQEKINRAAKNNFNSTVDPTSNDDSGDGYVEGSVWVNTTTDESFRLVDATSGAAQWAKTTLTADELGSMAFQNAAAVNISGGVVDAGTLRKSGNDVWHSGNFDPNTKSDAGHRHDNATVSSDGFMSSGDKEKIDGIEPGAEVNIVKSVQSRTGDVVITKNDVGLDEVDNTSDTNKPISTATQAALNSKSNTGHTHSTDEITSGEFADDRISQTSVTQHQGAFALSQSQIGGLVGALSDKVETSVIGAANGVATLDASQLLPLVQVPGLPTSRITSGTFSTARIPGLSASKITSGTFHDDRISQSAVKQYEGDLAVDWTQLTSVPNLYTTSEVDDLLAQKANLSQLPYACVGQYSSTDTTTNINADTEIVWNAVDIGDIVITVTGASITVTEDGLFDVYTSLAYENIGADDTDVRDSVGVYLEVNGVARSATGMGGYVRSKDSHNEASTSISEVLALSVGDTLKVKTRRMAGGDDCYLRANESVLKIVKVGGKSSLLAAQSIADVSGLQSALDAKANDGHKHDAADVETGEFANERISQSSIVQHQAALDIDWTQLTSVPTAFTPEAHAHIIDNVDGLESALDAKLDASEYTASDVLAKLLTVDGDASGLAAQTASKLSTAPKILLSGDAYGFASFDGSEDATITVTVKDDKHAHIIDNVDGLQAALDAKADLVGGKLNPTQLPDDIQGNLLVSGTVDTPQLKAGAVSNAAVYLGSGSGNLLREYFTDVAIVNFTSIEGGTISVAMSLNCGNLSNQDVGVWIQLVVTPGGVREVYDVIDYQFENTNTAVFNFTNIPAGTGEYKIQAKYTNGRSTPTVDPAPDPRKWNLAITELKR